MEKLLLALAMVASLSGCYPGIKYPDRESEYERQMEHCPEEYKRACQEQYEDTFGRRR